MGKRILAVDDSLTVRKMLNLTLSEAGYDVIEAENGVSALEMFERWPVDMLVTDLNMPQLDGIGLVSQVRRLPGHRFTPIIMLTTETQTLKRSDAKSAGVSGWIAKPFKAQQLLAVVRMVLR